MLSPLHAKSFHTLLKELQTSQKCMSVTLLELQSAHAQEIKSLEEEIVSLRASSGVCPPLGSVPPDCEAREDVEAKVNEIVGSPHSAGDADQDGQNREGPAMDGAGGQESNGDVRLVDLSGGRPEMPKHALSKSTVSTKTAKRGTLPKLHHNEPKMSGLSVLKTRSLLPSEWSLRALVASPAWEAFFGAVILGNAFVMATEAELEGQRTGPAMGFTPTYSAQTVDNAGEGIIHCEWIFGTMFILEVIVKILAEKLDFPRDVWNWIDFFCVVVWIVERGGTQFLSVNSYVVRIARLGRLLRLLRLVRTIKGFDPLVIMTVAMRSSLAVLFWTWVLLSLMQVLMALALTQYLHQHSYFTDEALPYERRQLLFEYFGTFLRAFFSMFELTLANWPPLIRTLAEDVNEVFFLIGILHKLSIGFACIGVINAVFIQETFKVAEMDDVLMVRRKEMATRMLATKMTELIEEASIRNKHQAEGKIMKDEFIELLQDSRVGTWLSSMDLRVENPMSLFHILDTDNNGWVTHEELVSGVGKLRGPAKGFELAELRRQHKSVHDAVQLLPARTRSSLSPSQSNVEALQADAKQSCYDL